MNEIRLPAPEPISYVFSDLLGAQMQLSSQTPTLTLRSYQPGDEQGIVALLNHTFGGARSVQEWIWRFKENPVGRVYATLGIADGTREIMAQYTATPTYINFVGEKILGCQSGDTAVHEQYQGQGLMVSTANHCYDALIADGFKVVYGFPNVNSFPAFHRRLNWNRIFNLRHYRKRLRVGPLPCFPLILLQETWNRFKCVRAIGNPRIAFRISSDIPGDWNSVWKSVASYDIFSIWKDHEYLNWRYVKNPQHKFLFFANYENGRLSSLAVGCIAAGVLTLLEMLSVHRDGTRGRLLASSIVSWAARRPALSDVVFEGRDDVFFDSVFGGFEVSASSLTFGNRALEASPSSQMMALPNNWSITGGDLDLR